MAQQQISVGVRQIWRSAGEIALAACASEIEPVHFLYGILRFGERSTSNGKDSQEQSQNSERSRLSLVLSGAGVDSGKLRNALWNRLVPSEPAKEATSSGSVRMGRSASTRAVFEAAAQANPNTELDGLNLLLALCQSGNAGVLQTLGSSATKIVSLATNTAEGRRENDPIGKPISIKPEPNPAELTVVLQCDATMKVKSPGAHFDNTERFIALCELSWETGTNASLDLMLQKVLDGLMKIVTADRGAILLLDRAVSGVAPAPAKAANWLLKAHSGGYAPRFSMTSIQKAVEQKIGIIWNKGGDLSASQADCGVEQGIYVPILADGEIFGAVCLDSTSNAVTFSSTDLRIVTALAHQIGLFIAYQQMRRGLTSEKRAMDRLLTSFSPRVRKLLVQMVQQGKLKLGGERALVSIVFVDVRGFTKLASSMDPGDLADFLNDYFSALSECVLRHEGTINDFVGDALVAVFGSPEPDPKHCYNALATAVEMQQAAAKLTQERIASGQVGCEIGIGVHSGEVVHGFIGSEKCMQYTVVGDVVNFASRYSTAAKGGTILLSPQVHALAWMDVQAVRITIPTKHEGDITAYQLEKVRS